LWASTDAWQDEHGGAAAAPPPAAANRGEFEKEAADSRTARDQP
jgi:hypothetical protein